MNLKWDSICLGDAAKVISGFAFKSQDFLEIGIPIIKIKNIRLGTVDLSEADFVTPDFIKKLDSKYHIHSNDILISLTGSHLTQPNSVVGRVAKHSPKLGLCLLNQRAGKIIITKSDLLDQKFLFYFLYTEETRRNIALMALGAASQANVSPTQVESLEIPLPPLPTQQKIAGILSVYDDLIENNTRRIEILEEMARMLYREWFVKFRFPGHEAVQFVESELGLIPENWKVKPIGETVYFHIGGGWGQEEKSDKFSRQAYVIRGTDIPSSKNNNIEKVPLRFHKESNFKSRKLEEGDIVFEVSGGSKGQPLGRSMIISRMLLNQFYYPVICASFCKLIRINSEMIDPILVYFYLLEIYDNRSIEKYSVQSTGISNFKFTFFLENELLIIPDRDLQKEFSEKINPLLKQIQVLGVKNINLRKTRDLLLPRLISGEIDVENLAINTGIQP